MVPVKNIAVDQAMEHSVRAVKGILEAHGANLNFSAAQLFSRASDKLEEIVANFDKESCVKGESNKYARKAQEKDIMLVVKVLAEKKCLKNILAAHIQALAQSRRIQLPFLVFLT